MGSIIEVVLGAIVAIVVTVCVEALRRPKLELGGPQHQDLAYEGRQADNVRFLCIDLRNSPVSRLLRWMVRQPALQCHGEVTFHQKDKQKIFTRSMPLRWSSSPEPLPLTFRLGDKEGLIWDRLRLTLDSRIDVYPGESERLAIAARFDDDQECYGWSNESYSPQHGWRNPSWRLPQGSYLVRVAVVSSGQKCAKTFRMINLGNRGDFRLEDAQPGEAIVD